MKIKNIVFDLDGTLLDTTEGILESVKYAAAELGYPELPRETLLTFIGPPVQNSFMENYGCGTEKAQQAANLFREYYKSTALLKANPYEGIYELCDLLQSKGIRMAVATYKREDYALTLLKHYKFDKYCDPMHGADNNNILKKSDIVQMCMDEMNAEPRETVLIGDTAHDAEGALGAKTAFIAVTYGFGFKDKTELEKYPNILGVANSPLEIINII